VEEAEDVVEARAQLDAQHSALWPMLVVLRIGQHVELEYRQSLSRHPEDMLISRERGSVSTGVQLAKLPGADESPGQED